MPVDNRVLIAGAGPVGLCAALGLAQCGVPVTVLEAEPGLTHDLRAGSYHPPTIEMLEDLGLGEALLERGIIVRRWQYWDRVEGLIAEFDLGLLAEETRHPYRLHLEQHRLTPLLLDRLGAYGDAKVLFETRVESVTQDDDGVAVTAETPDGPAGFRGRWLVGADGGRSAVRKALRVAFDGFTWPERLLVASTTTDLEAFGFAYNAYMADPALWAAIFKVPDDGPPGLWRVAYPTDLSIDEREVLDDEAVQHALAEILPADGPFPLKYRRTYRVHQRVAGTFRVGRVLLAGDAAHINNPLGGLGLNGGIHDAVNLAEKLAAVFHGEAEPTLLDRYDRQRRPVNLEHVQKQSIRNKNLMEAKDAQVRQRRNAEMRALAADPERARAHLLDTSMINSVRQAAAAK